MTFRAALLVLAAAVAAAVALPAAATSYVMVSDQALVARSAAAVEARVLSVDTAPTTGRIYTDYLIEVDRVLAGEVPGRNLVVRLPGGVRDDVGLKLFGVPELAQGEQVLLFLNPRHDGTFGVTDLMLGAFRQVVREGRRVLVRSQLSEATELAMPGEPAGSRDRYSLPRDAAAFGRWIEAVGRGRQPEADYFLEPAVLGTAGDPGRVTDEYSLFTGSGLNMRWFDFEEGAPVEWEIQSGGQPGYTQKQTIDAFKTGLNVWNADGGSNVDYRYLSPTAPTTGELDRHNTLIFANIDGSVPPSDGDFTCGPGGGGVLAIGGPWYGTPSSRPPVPPRPGPHGLDYRPILEAEITTNKGIECYLTVQPNPQAALEQLLAHELGHTLGIGHSCGESQNCATKFLQALMNAIFQPGVGAVLNSDDRAAVQFLYPGAATNDPPAAPSDLIPAALGPDEVRLTWSDNSSDENGFTVQGTIAGGAFVPLATLPANTTTTVIGGLEDDTLYEFRVRAFNGAGPSEWSPVVAIETELGPPEAPSELLAAPASATSVSLTWVDGSDNESEFVVEARNPASPGDGWSVVKSGVVAVPDSPTVTTVVDGLTTGVPYVFRVVARNAAGDSAPSNTDAATPNAAIGSGGCDDSGDAICLLGDRFQVSVDWRRYDNGVSGSGKGAVFPQSDRSGTFWFFNAENIELVVKVLDGSGLNDHYWTFYGALSDVEYWITVVDTELENSRTYYNPPRNQCGEFDTASLPATNQPVEGESVAALPFAAPARVTAAAGTCVEDDTTLCLLDGRFAVTVEWDDQHNDRTGVGHVAAGTGTSDKTGYFWFFNEANVELVVKALDGTVPTGNGHFWFFYGSLSDVEYHITVTDTTSGQSRVYDNEPGNQCGQFDTTAFTAEGEVPE
jgi:hypothetical protein